MAYYYADLIIEVSTEQKEKDTGMERTDIVLEELQGLLWNIADKQAVLNVREAAQEEIDEFMTDED